MSKAVATVTLRDRARRRQFISGLLLIIIIIFCLGNWPLASWLSKGIWRFLFYWGGCTLLCLFLILMAVFDALSVIKEEREKLGLGDDLDKS